MTETELINEVKSTFEEAVAMNLFDENKVSEALRDGLSNIGGHYHVSESFIEVSNGVGELPDNFKKIQEAHEIIIEAYEAEDDCNPIKHAPVYGILKRICNGCTEYSHMDTSNFKSYTKRHIWGDTKIFYKESRALLIKNRVHKINPNLRTIRRNRINEGYVQVDNNHIYPDFDEGFLYIMYLSYPTGSSGEIEIPDTARMDLKNYILNKSKAAISKDIMIKDRDEFMGKLYQDFQEKEYFFYNRAEYEMKMSSIYNKDFKKLSRAFQSIRKKRLSI